MAKWRKIVVSGSDANLNSLNLNHGLDAKSLTASNVNPLKLPNISLLPAKFNPLVIDDNGLVFKGAEYAPAAGVEGSTTVGVQGSLPNNVVIIGAGNSLVQTASLNQNVDFNSSNLFNVNEISASGLLFISSSEQTGQSHRVLVQDLSTGRIYHTGSYHEGVHGYFDLINIPANIVSNSLQFTNTDDVEFRNITASVISTSNHIIANTFRLGSSTGLFLGSSHNFNNEDTDLTLQAGINGEIQIRLDGTNVTEFADSQISFYKPISTAFDIISSANIKGNNISASNNLNVGNSLFVDGTSELYRLEVTTLITASNVNASEVISSNEIQAVTGSFTGTGSIPELRVSKVDGLNGTGNITFKQDLVVNKNISSSGHISASGNVTASGLFISGDTHIVGGLDLDGVFDHEGFNFVQDNVTIITGSNSFGSTASLNQHTFTGSIVISSSQSPSFTVLNDNTPTVTITPAGTFTATSAVINGNITSSNNISASGHLYGDQVHFNQFITNEGGYAVGSKEVGGNNFLLGNAALSLNLYGNSITLHPDVTASHNISSSGNITASILYAENGIYGTLLSTDQPNLTSFGTLSTLSVSGVISASALSASSYISASKLYAENGIYGTLQTNDQPNITSLGTLSNLSVNNIISASIINARNYISASALHLEGGIFTSESLANAIAGNAISSVTATAISGSWQGFISGSGIVSSSLQFTNTDNVTFGQITSSGTISASGLLFASLSLAPTHTAPIVAVVYDSASGQFYYTGSYGSGGGGTGFGFPFEGSAVITGSLHVSGTLGDLTKIETPVEITKNVIIDGNLTVNGETTTINVSELSVEDRFITIGSGSSADNVPDTDVGIIFDVDNVDGTGSVFFYDHDENRFAFGNDVNQLIGDNSSVGGGNIGAGSHAGFVVTTTIAENNTHPSDADAKFGFGELRILNNGDVYIYTNDQE